MSQVLDIFQGYYICRYSFVDDFRLHRPPSLQHKLSSHAFNKYHGVQFSARVNSKLLACAELNCLSDEAKACDGAELDAFPHVQTLREFPQEELSGKVIMVRFDSKILLHDQHFLRAAALSTIKYLFKAGAKVVLVSSWDPESNSKVLSAESVAEFLSSILGLKVVHVEFVTRGMLYEAVETNILLLENLFYFKEEPANCKTFAKKLSSGVDIFVNDAFSQSHKALTSTVGIAGFCYACIAGFYFEDGLCQLKDITKTSKKPYFAIIGGSNLVEKAAALHNLVSICDGLVFVGNIAFQIMHALGFPVPVKLVERGAVKEALTVVEFATSRRIQIFLPKDFLCTSYLDPEKFEIFSADCLTDGWQPVDLGPNSLQEIASLLSKCKKILWIGPVKFGSSVKNCGGASKLASVLCNLKQSDLDITVVGKMACGALMGNCSFSTDDAIENASIVWEFLKGRNLPGLMALDRAYAFEIDWYGIYADPTRSLVVDVGSGNGLFLFGMARVRKDLNFLGLEINEKLVNRCLKCISQLGIKNGYFIRTNATSTFRSIVSSYPGDLVLVSIQCPNPDFNKPEQRWRMLQRSLVEAIADLLASGGKVFLQSDIEAVAVRMKSEFLKYGKGKLMIIHESDDSPFHRGQWLNENPCGVRSDWEQHVLDRGAPMYRLLLSKSSSNCPK